MFLELPHEWLEKIEVIFVLVPIGLSVGILMKSR